MLRVLLRMIQTASELLVSDNTQNIFCRRNISPALNRMGSVSSTKKSAIMPATRDLVNELIAKDSVVIFSKTYCPYCKMAKQVFESLKKPYTAVELDNREDAQDIQDVLGEITGARTVPRVFLNGECLGGGTDVKKLYDSGELEKKF